MNGHRRFLKAKVASLVVVGTLVGGTGMAVAGVLPAPIQDAASTVFANVGISIPNSGTSVHHPASSGEDISKIATTTTKTGVQKGAEISSTASGGMSHAGEDTGANGSSGASAGGTQTGDQASGGRNSTGVDHSSVGAGNGTQDPAGDGPGATPAGNAP